MHVVMNEKLAERSAINSGGAVAPRND
jgi:hypothetical protein